MSPTAKHLTPEDSFHFIEGGLEGPRKILVEQHLVTCSECLEVLDLILLAEAPTTPEEEVVLSGLLGSPLHWILA